MLSKIATLKIIIEKTALVLILFFGGSSAVLAQCDPCPGPGEWDTRNCFVFSAPPGSTAFLYQGGMYVTSPTGTASGCPTGTTWDTKNCHVGAIPQGRFAFVYDNKLYLQPACDPPGPPKWLRITEVKLNTYKSGRLDRDDVSFAAVLYNNNDCSKTPLARESFAKIAQRHVGDWRSPDSSSDITAPNALLGPNHTIALMLYDRDSCGNCEESWDYDFHCNGSLYGRTKSAAYGTVYIRYSSFPEDDFIAEFDLGGARLRISGKNH